MAPEDDPSPTPRKKRDSLGVVIKRNIKTMIVPALTTLALALLGLATQCVNQRANKAQSTASKAVKAGVTGAEIAAETQVGEAKRYDATKEKLEATGDFTAEMATELKALREKVEKLEAARASRPPREVKTIEVPPDVVKDLPPTPTPSPTPEILKK